MRMIFAAAALCGALLIAAAGSAAVILPADGDDYSKLVARADVLMRVQVHPALAALRAWTGIPGDRQRL